MQILDALCLHAYILRSHECNPLCQRLRLTPFIRCPADVEAVEGTSAGSQSQGKTVSRAYRKSSMIRRTVELNRAASVEEPPGTFDAKEHRRRVGSIPLSVPDLYARCVGCVGCTCVDHNLCLCPVDALPLHILFLTLSFPLFFT